MIRHNGIVIDRKRRRISVDGKIWREPDSGGNNSRPRMVFDAIAVLILSGHLTRRQWFHLVYGRSPNGGPLEGPNVFSIHLNHWVPIFTALGLKLQRETKAGEQYLSLRRAL